MKNIKLKSLTIVNFKGIKKFTLNSPSNYVSVYGANASGKTTIFDAFNFLLFGKDSTDRKDFEIKPLDMKGSKTDRLNCEVEAVIEVDGKIIELRRVLTEIWSRVKRAEEETFVRNEHEYYWNTVPVQANEYKSMIEEIIPEHVFKLLTNPLYFNSLHWEKRRGVLQEIAGEITDEEASSQKPEFAQLFKDIAGFTLKEFLSKKAKDWKKLKEELEKFEPVIEEKLREKALLQETDLSGVEQQIDTLQAQYDEIEKQIDDRNEAQKKENETALGINQQILTAQTNNQSIRAKHEQAYNTDLTASKSAEREFSVQLVRKQADFRSLQTSLQSQKHQLSALESSHQNRLGRIDREGAETKQRLESLRVLWGTVSAREIDPNSLVCKECGRDHEAHNIEELTLNFNTKKKEELEGLNKVGQQLNADLSKFDGDREQAINEYELAKSSLETTVTDLNSQISVIETEIAGLKQQLMAINEKPIEVESVDSRLLNDQAYQLNLNIIKELEEALANRPGVDISDLRVKKATINAELDSAKRKLSSKDQIKAIDDRITELKAQEKVMAQQLADIEKLEFVAQSYEKFKSEELERRVNGMFKYARFKMFNQLINGGEEPTCVTTYQGVPFTDLNNAAKVMIGLDIINTLSAHHGVTAPVFLDNRESVSSIPDTAAQVINLIVSPDDKVLRVA